MTTVLLCGRSWCFIFHFIIHWGVPGRLYWNDLHMLGGKRGRMNQTGHRDSFFSLSGQNNAVWPCVLVWGCPAASCPCPFSSATHPTRAGGSSGPRSCPHKNPSESPTQPCPSPWVTPKILVQAGNVPSVGLMWINL